MSRSPAMSSAASVSLPCLRHADPAEAADGSARASDRGYEPFADAIRSVLLGIAALDGRPAADQLRSELPVPAAQASLGQLAHLDRIVQISNHIYDSQSAFDKPSTSTSGELPGIYYLINPFAGRELHDAINLVSPRRFTWTHIMEALEKGTLDGLFDMRPTFPERHAVEQMILSLVFLTMHSQSTCNAPAAKALFGETITRILRKELPLQRGSTLSTNLWWDVFRFKSVRFRPAGDSVRDHFWLEQLEKIRLDQAASDGLIRRTPQSPPLSSVEMKRLSNLLSSSLYTAVDFAKSCPTIAVANLEILSEYANQLPLNWFTTAILDFALDVLDQWSGPNSPQQKGFVLDSGHALKFLAAWLRKADVTKTDRRANRTLEIVASGVESAKPAVTPSVTWIVAALNCLSALYAKLEENMKTLILTTLYELLSKLLPVVEESRIDDVFPALANLLISVKPSELGILSQKSVSAMILANPDLPDRDSCILERAMKMCLLFEHSVRARWNASHVEARPQKSIGWRAWFLSKLKASEGPVRLSNQLPEWLASILSSVSEINGLQSNNENDCIARLSLLLGTCRGFTTSKAPAGSENRLAEPKDLMETLIASLTEQLAVSLGICSLNSPLSYQVMVSLSASQIFSAKPIQDFQGLPYDFKLLLKVCLNVLLFHPQALATDNSPEADRLLQGDIAGLSRLCGGLAALCWAAGDGKSVAEAAECLANFSCGVQGLLNARVQSGNIPNTAPQTTRTSPSFFNLALFGVTMVVQQIIETIVDVPVDFEDSIEDTWTATAVAELDIISSALRSLSYLHGITLNFGFDGFKAWRDVLDACTERLVLLTSDDSEKAVPPVSKILLLLLPLYKDEFVSSSEKDKSELLFALQVTRRLFRHIPPQTMENEVFPRLFPYFTYNLPKDLAKETWKPSNSDSDLLEFSHELAVSLFKNVHKFRDFVTAFSPWYTETLVSAFPEFIDLSLLRRSYSYMVKSLSSLSGPQRRVRLPSEEDADEFAVDAETVTEPAPADSFSVDFINRPSSEPRVRRSEEEADDDEPENSDSVNESMPSRHGEDPWIGEQLAWNCAYRLIEEVESLTEQIKALEKSGEQAVPASPKRGEGRFAEILNAAPASVKLRVRREGLLVATFDQIRTIGLFQLETLLRSIRGLLLYGSASSGDLTVAETVREFLRRAKSGQAATDAFGIGVQSDADRSEMWKMLYGTVGHSRGFDQVRRVRCVQWYLELRRDAMALRQSLEKWRSKGESSLSSVGNGATNHAPLPPGHPLRARL